MRFRPQLFVALLLGCATSVEPLSAPPPPVETTGALIVPAELTVTLVAPSSGPYRAEILGSKPEPVQLELSNGTDVPRDISPAKISFNARRGAVQMRCKSESDLRPRDPSSVAAHSSITLMRELCSLPIPGHYDVDVMGAFGDAPAKRVGSFAFEVTPGERNVPRELASYPGLFAALGGDLTGMKLTKPEWKSGAYHVVLRVTNASSNELPAGHAEMIFRVTKDNHPLACTDTKPVELPARIAPGDSATASIPVTCLVDMAGMYQIHASLAFARNESDETELAVIYVQVTSDPLIYLPIWPY